MNFDILGNFNSEAFVGLIAAITGILVLLLTRKYQRKNLEFQAILQVFQLLSDEKHRHARRTIYNAYEDWLNNDGKSKIFLDDEYRDASGLVREDFEQIATLIYRDLKESDMKKKNVDKTWYGSNKGYLPKELFLNAH